MKIYNINKQTLQNMKNENYKMVLMFARLNALTKIKNIAHSFQI